MQGRQAGSALIAALIALGIVLIIAMVVLDVLVGQRHEVQRIRTFDAVSEVQEQLRVRALEQFAAYVEESLCGTDGEFDDIDWTASESVFTLAWLKGSLVPTVLNYTGSPEHEDAKQRCLTRQTYAGGNESIGNRSHVYFCLSLVPKTGSETSALLAEGPAFAEIAVDFVDSVDSSVRTCEYLVDPDDGKQAIYSRGMHVTTQLYWRGTDGKALAYGVVPAFVHAKLHD